MATLPSVYVGGTLPAKIVRASGTTLFHVAAAELGDATQWYRIAALNGMTDPWITAQVELLIPQPGISNGGVLNA